MGENIKKMNEIMKMSLYCVSTLRHCPDLLYKCESEAYEKERLAIKKEMKRIVSDYRAKYGYSFSDSIKMIITKLRHRWQLN